MQKKYNNNENCKVIKIFRQTLSTFSRCSTCKLLTERKASTVTRACRKSLHIHRHRIHTSTKHMYAGDK